jgi:hypothetical protein
MMTTEEMLPIQINVSSVIVMGIGQMDASGNTG